MRIYSKNTIFEFVFAQWPSREEEKNLSPYISYSSSLDVEKNSRGLRRGKNDHIIVRASSNHPTQLVSLKPLWVLYALVTEVVLHHHSSLHNDEKQFVTWAAAKLLIFYLNGLFPLPLRASLGLSQFLRM